MSSTNVVSNRLNRLYEQYVGEPDSVRDVYGYWIFVLGYVAGIFGVAFFLVATIVLSGDLFLIKEIGSIFAALGLAINLFGIVLLLPVRRRGVQFAVVGLLLAVAGVVNFSMVYPSSFNVAGATATTAQVTAIYVAGVGIIGGIIVLVPVLTGQKGLFVEEEGVTEHPPILLGEALEDAMFAVFRNDQKDWTWNIVHQEALATSDSTAATRPDAEAAIDQVKTQIGNASLLEITTAAFRLYETKAGDWRWTLMRDDGSVVAGSEQAYQQRDGAEDAVSFLKDRAPGAEVVDIDGAAFSYRQDEDGWHWELLDEDRSALASGATVHTDRSGAEREANRMADDIGDARVLAVEDFAVELFETRGDWQWRLLDADDTAFAESTATFDSRRAAESSAESVTGRLGGAARTVAGEPTFEHYEEEGAWHWRLVDGSDDVSARNYEAHGRNTAAETSAAQFEANVRDADVVEIDDADYEVYPVDDEDEEGERYHWRLVTEDREVLADSTDAHQSDEAAKEAIEEVRDQAENADLIEFEEAAFQVYEAGGEWRWRLIDEDGGVMADSGEEHDSRSDATQSMLTLKEKAPDADIIEIDEAAFELFRDDDGDWGWRLIDEAGHMVAECPRTYDSRGTARTKLNEYKGHLDGRMRTMDDAVFQTYTDGDDWRWWFVLVDGTVVAESEGEHPTRDDLLRTIETVREDAAGADTFTVGELSIQLFESGDWDFRLLDRDREVLGQGTRGYDSREEAETVVDDLQANAEDAPVFTLGDALVWVSRDDAGWTWTLIDDERDPVATGPSEATRDGTLEAVDRVKHYAPEAGRIEFGTATFELYQDDETGWHWRLLDADRNVVAASATAYETDDAAHDALEDARDMIGGASILEIDSATFELHHEEDGWLWRLVDENAEALAESTQRYESRVDAREAMTVVKEHAPEGWHTFSE